MIEACIAPHTSISSRAELQHTPSIYCITKHEPKKSFPSIAPMKWCCCFSALHACRLSPQSSLHSSKWCGGTLFLGGATIVYRCRRRRNVYILTKHTYTHTPPHQKTRPTFGTTWKTQQAEKKKKIWRRHFSSCVQNTHIIYQLPIEWNGNFGEATKWVLNEMSFGVSTIGQQMRNTHTFAGLNIIKCEMSSLLTDAWMGWCAMSWRKCVSPGGRLIKQNNKKQ